MTCRDIAASDQQPPAKTQSIFNSEERFMRYRQIHLDFHTSERIPGIGSRFDPEDFARTFADADVDSVTIFSKCHHGWSYHPTEVGKQHPHLDFDLTRGQLDASTSRASTRRSIFRPAGTNWRRASIPVGAS